MRSRMCIISSWSTTQVRDLNDINGVHIANIWEGRLYILKYNKFI